MPAFCFDHGLHSQKTKLIMMQVRGKSTFHFQILTTILLLLIQSSLSMTNVFLKNCNLILILYWSKRVEIAANSLIKNCDPIVITPFFLYTLIFHLLFMNTNQLRNNNWKNTLKTLNLQLCLCYLPDNITAKILFGIMYTFTNHDNADYP